MNCIMRVSRILYELKYIIEQIGFTAVWWTQYVSSLFYFIYYILIVSNFYVENRSTFSNVLFIKCS